MRLTSGPLASFLSALGLPAQATETAERLTISADVDGQTVRDLDYAVVEQLLDSYGETLTAELRLEDLLEFEIKTGMTTQVFQACRANFTSGTSYGLRLRIDKRLLLDRILGPEAAGGTIHYFFATSVEGILARGLSELEITIWPDSTGPKRLLIADTDLQRSGPTFQVVGGTNLTNALPALTPLAEPIRDSIERIRADREEQVSWDHQWVQRLTPIQLQLDGEPGGSGVEEMFAAAYIQLCLLYTCDRARRRPTGPGEWETQAEYRGSQVTVQVPLREAHPVGTQITGAVTLGFAGLIDWCYRLRDEDTTRDWAPDRLQFTQVRISQVLDPVPEADRLTTLIGQIANLVAALDDQWRAFIEDRLGQYLDKEHQLETVVNQTVITFGEKTRELTKSLSDTMLAAVAALIGSAIAAAFKTPFNAALFRVGVLTYAGYALIFPGLYGLGSQVGQFLEIAKSFDHEKTRFDALLGADRSNQTVGDRITRAKRRYWRWFYFTAFGYAIAIAAAIIAALTVPSLVK